MALSMSVRIIPTQIYRTRFDGSSHGMSRLHQPNGSQ